MGLFNNKSNPDKVMLQNIVLGINEKKMQVSDEFLQNMAKVYVSKRMKLINDTVSNYEQLNRVSSYFKKSAYVNRLMDELIAIEPYYIFNYPRPTEYRQNLEDNEENFINQILNKSWRLLRYDQNNPRISPEVNAYFADVKSVWDSLPDSSHNFIDELHNMVYGHTASDELKPPVPEEPEEQVFGEEIGPEDSAAPEEGNELDIDIGGDDFNIEEG